MQIADKFQCLDYGCNTDICASQSSTSLPLDTAATKASGSHSSSTKSYDKTPSLHYVPLLRLQAISARSSFGSVMSVLCNLSISNWRYRSKKKAFTKASLKWSDDTGKQEIEKDLNKIKRYCAVVRVLAHTQVQDCCASYHGILKSDVARKLHFLCRNFRKSNLRHFTLKSVIFKYSMFLVIIFHIVFIWYI